MADAESGMGSHREGRQERRRVPRQPGASGAPDEGASPDEATEQARKRLGKTDKHVSENE